MTCLLEDPWNSCAHDTADLLMAIVRTRNYLHEALETCVAVTSMSYSCPQGHLHYAFSSLLQPLSPFLRSLLNGPESSVAQELLSLAVEPE